jgi:hypothetical protein
MQLESPHDDCELHRIMVFVIIPPLSGGYDEAWESPAEAAPLGCKIRSALQVRFMGMACDGEHEGACVSPCVKLRCLLSTRSWYIAYKSLSSPLARTRMHVLYGISVFKEM